MPSSDSSRNARLFTTRCRTQRTCSIKFCAFPIADLQLKKVLEGMGELGVAMEVSFPCDDKQIFFAARAGCAAAPALATLRCSLERPVHRFRVLFYHTARAKSRHGRPNCLSYHR